MRKVVGEKNSALFVIPNLTFGGIQTQVFLLAKYFKEQLGMEVMIWGVNTAEKSFLKTLDENGIKSEIHPEINFFLSSEYFRLSKIGKIKKWLVLRKKINTGGFKIILPYTRKIDLVFRVIWRFSTAKLCFSFERGGHSQPKKRPFEIYDWFGNFTRPVYVANTEHGRVALSKMKGVKLENIHLIRNGFEPLKESNFIDSWEKLNLKNSFLVTMIANFFSEKDHITVIKAWSKLNSLRDFENFLLIFAGLGGSKICQDNFQKARKMVTELGLDERIIFLGSISNKKKLLEVSQIGLLSSRSEGCPNAVLEYMGAGLPVVGTNIPGIREVLPFENHKYLFQVEDVNGCVQVLSDLIDNPRKMNEIGKRNQDHVLKYFKPEIMYSSYKTILKKKNLI